jgi:hypothetical protein
MRKKNCKGEEHNELPRALLGERSSLSYLTTAVLLSCITSRQTTSATTNNADRATVSATKGISENRSVSRNPSSSNDDTVATVVHQIMTKLTKAVSEEHRVMVITKLVLNLMQQNGL